MTPLTTVDAECYGPCQSTLFGTMDASDGGLQTGRVSLAFTAPHDDPSTVEVHDLPCGGPRLCVPSPVSYAVDRQR